jgi:hypothetical protein
VTTSAVLVFAALAWGGAYFIGGLTTNPVSRYVQTVAIVAHGHLYIDRYVRLTPDWSVHDGHYYPNKPPGIALLGVVPYFALYHIERLSGTDPTDPSRFVWRANGRLLALLLNGLPVALAGAMLIATLARLGVSLGAAVCGALAWGLATLILPYTTALWSHPHIAALLMMSLHHIVAHETVPDARRLAGAGALAGLAVLSEYLAAVAVVGLGAYVARRGWRELATFCAGGAPSLAILFAYQAVCFGSPWDTGQMHLNPVFLVPGFHPSAPVHVRLAQLSFGPYRGLLFHTPLFLLAVPGVARMWFEGRRALALISVLVPAASLIALASLDVWYTGANIGPRYLIPMASFLILPTALAFERWRRTAVVLGAISLANALATATVDVIAPPTDPIPLFHWVYGRLVRGVYVHTNLGRMAGLPGLWSLVPLAAVWLLVALALRRCLRAAAARPVG